MVVYKHYLILLLIITVTFTSYSRNNSEKFPADKVIVQLEGLVELGSKNKVSIKTNWQSKSSVSHTISGDYAEELGKSLGKIVLVEGYISQEFSPWRKELVVTEILEIKNSIGEN